LRLRKGKYKKKDWGCPELTDSGLGVKTEESPDEDTVKQTEPRLTPIQRCYSDCSKGKLDPGRWEQVFYGEFDGRRRKRALVKIIDE